MIFLGWQRGGRSHENSEVNLLIGVGGSFEVAGGMPRRGFSRKRKQEGEYLETNKASALGGKFIRGKFKVAGSSVVQPH